MNEVKVIPNEVFKTKHHMGFTNDKCGAFPCHKGVKGEFNCLGCYCPLAFLECPGPYKIFEDKNGIVRKDCSGCKLPHDGYEKSWNFIQKWLEKPVPWGGK